MNKAGSRLTHGHRRNGATSAEYNIWMKMRSRCNNPKDRAYADYGGRGISIEPRWDSFEAFLEDMGRRPSPAHSIDRVDNNKGYCAANCRWATWKQQQRNRRNNKIYTIDGVTATLPEHCERTGVKYKTAHMRLSKGAPLRVAISPERPKYGTLRRLNQRNAA
ncbi:hypothetical protein [Stenotrophomonas sp. ATCM1_4]|uniref:hypothetical protein n=1 Tax=Stenotrophomonas sp. ATCM1_4 TaxID=2259330 RepID=UPI00105270E5|nr:hypothetical protein [Stenotrophomonas sp. ATCM1_4]